ncbi:hypothetical protein RIR_jg12914.t1 [Rhizophagus irregularis DAOM 181602=DAOM 197198]|nr:hypothetical protein RIR_jg12914.t1 [Rhizophagus irregularis DAOM 181602=DAOM 197198]
MPEVLKNINKLDKIVNIEEEEQIMALKERQLQLRECEAKIRILELQNIQIQMEKEIGRRLISFSPQSTCTALNHFNCVMSHLKLSYQKNWCMRSQFFWQEFSTDLPSHNL